MNIEDLLMDKKPEYWEFENLPQPLVPLPVDSVFLDDIYSLPPVTSQRWRSFINVENWDPKQFHDDLLKRRAYHARMCWEATLLLSFTDSSWLGTKSYEMIKDVAYYNLRVVEFEMISFQLTCGMIGLGSKQHHDLFHASVGLYTTTVWIVDKILERQRVKKTMDQRKSYSQMILCRPGPSMTCKELCILIDQMIHELQEILKKEILFVDGVHDKTELMVKLSKRFEHIILAMDKILIVF